MATVLITIMKMVTAMMFNHRHNGSDCDSDRGGDTDGGSDSDCDCDGEILEARRGTAVQQYNSR